MLRWAGRAAAGAAALLLLSAAGAWLLLRATLPELDGTVEIAALDAPVVVARDRHGVPHIRAESMRDAYVALGYAHAQDRLAQMETTRRMAAGRMAEVVGSSMLESDRRMRMLGVYRLAEGDAEALPAEVREAYERYAEGVNAYIDHGPLPPELRLLGIRPEPWRIADSFAWHRLLAVMLSHNWEDELFRHRLLDRLSPQQIRDLYPSADADEVVSIAAAPVPTERLDEAQAFAGSLAYRGGSNVWAAGPERSESGAPLLANDPHFTLSTPSVWYLVRIETPELTLAGATAPGRPHLLLGHNGHVAWGITMSYVDTSDVVLQRIDPDDPTRYLTPHGPRSFDVRRETIRVRWGADETIDVYETRHGTLITERGDPGGVAIALAHMGLRPRDTSAVALFDSNRAQSWVELRDALRWITAPHQNILVADRDGMVAMISAGQVPIRRESDGFMPTPGWTGEADWIDRIPFDELPQVVAPTDGVIVNANNRLVDAAFPHWLGDEWEAPHRAERILEMLSESDAHSAAGFARMQQDVVSLGMRRLLDLLLEPPLRPDAADDILAALDAWDGAKAADRPEPPIAVAWLRKLDQALIAPRLGPLYEDWEGADARVMRGLLDRHAARWCEPRDDGHPCAAVVAHSLDRALARLRARFGDDWRTWRWDEVREARFPHPALEAVPPLGAMVNPRIPGQGGNDTVNRGAMDLRDDDRPFDQVHGPTFRAVYDLADLNSSLFIVAPGQSGHPLSPHFDDLLTLWHDGGYLTLAPLADPGHRLDLLPSARPAAGGPRF